MKDSPIIITGCARSGTSMVAGIINMHNVWGGDLAGATKFNQKGMFENRVIINSLIKPYLRSIGADAMGQNPLPMQSKVLLTDDWDHKVYKIIEKQGYPSDEPLWFFKAAKAALIWKVWNQAFPKARWLIVRRDDEDIINSCINAPFMRNNKTREEWQNWINYHKERFEEIKYECASVTEVWSKNIVVGNYDQISKFLENLGIEFNSDSIEEFVDKKLFHLE